MAKRKDRLGVTYETVHINSWNEFVGYISGVEDMSHYIFRGLSNSLYPLRTTLARALPSNVKSMSREHLNSHLNNFRSAIRGRISQPDPYLTQEEELWSIGQHFGLATPLLDWTESPYVAAYFAFSKAGDGRSESRSIVMLNAPAVENDFYAEISRRVNMLGDSVPEQLEEVIPLLESTHNGLGLYPHAILQIVNRNIFVSPVLHAKCKFIHDDALKGSIKLIRPVSGVNARLLNQRGLFTFTFRMGNLEDWVPEKLRDKGRPVLIKLVLPEAARTDVLKALFAMNINHATLFPDLLGAAIHCNALLAQQNLSLGSFPPHNG